MSGLWMNSLTTRHVGSQHGYGHVEEFEVEYATLGPIDGPTIVAVQRRVASMFDNVRSLVAGDVTRQRGSISAPNYEISVVTYKVVTNTPSAY